MILKISQSLRSFEMTRVIIEVKHWHILWRLVQRYKKPREVTRPPGVLVFIISDCEACPAYAGGAVPAIRQGASCDLQVIRLFPKRAALS
jgi:hypothetical protein